jgi:hypothetical protein
MQNLLRSIFKKKEIIPHVWFAEQLGTESEVEKRGEILVYYYIYNGKKAPINYKVGNNVAYKINKHKEFKIYKITKIYEPSPYLDLANWDDGRQYDLEYVYTTKSPGYSVRNYMNIKKYFPTLK